MVNITTYLSDTMKGLVTPEVVKDIESQVSQVLTDMGIGSSRELLPAVSVRVVDSTSNDAGNIFAIDLGGITLIQADQVAMAVYLALMQNKVMGHAYKTNQKITVRIYGPIDIPIPI